jgi:hypothetical protein
MGAVAERAGHMAVGEFRGRVELAEGCLSTADM